MTEEIRRRNLERARQLGYPTNDRLPLLDAVDEFRGLEEATDRLLCLYSVVACSYGFSKEKAQVWLVREGVDGALSESDRLYLEMSPDSGPDTSRQWQVEALWALAWCVSCHDELDFSDSCSDAFIQMLPDIAKDAATGSFRESLSLRDKQVVLEKADLAYCLHWAIRDAEIEGQPVPGKVPGNVVVERRRALEWMISRDGWDEVQLDT